MAVRHQPHQRPKNRALFFKLVLTTEQLPGLADCANVQAERCAIQSQLHRSVEDTQGYRGSWTNERIELALKIEPVAADNAASRLVIYDLDD